MKVFSPKHFAAIVGIDWADKKHDICEYNQDKQHYALSIISSKPESIDVWANGLKQRYPNQQIAVGCELKEVLIKSIKICKLLRHHILGALRNEWLFPS